MPDLSGRRVLVPVLAGLLLGVVGLPPSSSSSRFGEGGSRRAVAEVSGFPRPQEFFSSYVLPADGGGVPLVMRGAARASPALELWHTDDYFLSLHLPPQQALDLVVETKKKEDRRQPTVNMDFQEFVRQYNDSEYFLVNPVPHFLLKDVLVPGPLQCPDVAEIMVENIMWFSSGGTKSVAHTDAVDNINCLYSGDKEVILIDPIAYGDQVLLDHPEGAYSGVDVDQVDYDKYPGLASAEYYHVNVTAGDCLYIPYKWIHQIRSYGRNIAVNVWWDHHRCHDLDLSDCPPDLDPEFTFEDAEFIGFNNIVKTVPFLRDQFEDYAKSHESRQLSLDRLMHILTVNYGDDLLESGYGYTIPLKQMIITLDTDSNEVVDLEEIRTASNEMWEVVAENMEKFETIIESFEEMMGHLEEEEEFERDEL